MHIKRFKSTAIVLVSFGMLFLNMGASYVIFTVTRQFYLMALGRVYEGGRLTKGLTSPIPFIIRTWDATGLILTGISILVFAVLVEGWYSKSESIRLILLKFACILGCQSVFLGVVHVATEAVLGFAFLTPFGVGLFTLELLAGVALILVFARLRKRVQG